VAREENRHRLVADLPVGHRAAVILVLRDEEHRQQVAADIVSTMICPPLGDHAVDDGVEPLARVARAAHRSDRQPFDHVGERHHAEPEGGHHVGQRAADLAGLRFDVDVEERLAGDRQGDAHHLLRHVERGVVAPLPAQLVGVVDHGLCVGGDAIAVKSPCSVAGVATKAMFAAGEMVSWVPW